MISSLKFVKGAVAKQGFIPALTHFRISRGTVRGFNGQMALCAPISSDLDCCPNAKQFVRALDACTDTVALHLKGSKLVVQSGKFRAFVDCDNPANYPDIVPGGRWVNIGPELYDALHRLEPFIAEDERRPWACGILLEADSAFATNNIVAVEVWHGLGLPLRANLPKSAVQEMLRIGQAPTRLQFETNRIAFHWPDGRWLTTQLLESVWPDLGALLKPDQPDAVEMTQDMLDALGQLVPLCDKSDFWYFHGSHISTSADSEDTGASVEVECPEAGAFNARQLVKINALGHVAYQWSAYPKAVHFWGITCRGIITGRAP